MTDEDLFAVLDAVLPGKVFSPIAPAGTAEPYVIFQDLFKIGRASCRERVCAIV